MRCSGHSRRYRTCVSSWIARQSIWGISQGGQVETPACQGEADDMAVNADGAPNKQNEARVRACVRCACYYVGCAIIGGAFSP